MKTLKEKFEYGLITRGEYLEALGITDNNLDAEKAHCYQLIEKEHYGWLVRYLERLNLYVSNWSKNVLDEAINMAYDCRQLKDWRNEEYPFLRRLDYEESIESLKYWIEELEPTLPEGA